MTLNNAARGYSHQLKDKKSLRKRKNGWQARGKKKGKRRKGKSKSADSFNPGEAPRGRDIPKNKKGRGRTRLENP